MSLTNQSLLFAILVSVTIEGTASAQNSVPINNNTAGPMSLWVWTVDANGRGAWTNQLFLRPGQVRSLDLRAAGNWYLVARDDGGRDFTLGWYDLKAEVQKNPNVEFLLQVAYESRMKLVSVWDPNQRKYVERQVEERVNKVILVSRVPGE